MLQQARQVLEKYYGYPSFREGQESIIARILDGTDVLGIMPTGGGKSICYQIPALLLPGVTLVISPLISLMKDQIDTLESMGVAATFINSSLTGSEVSKRLARAGRGEYKMIYIAPERLESDRFLSMLQDLSVAMVAIDEAHCISSWGHDFRPSYRAITSLLRELPNRPRVAAFTATATPEVISDITSYLGIGDGEVFLTGFNRENLKFSVIKGENKKDYLLRYVNENKDQAGIVYAATRKDVDNLYEFLRKKGIAAGKYHAGLSDTERKEAQERFIFDDIRVMVASNAFGMGIDKSNVRYVIHYNMPRNMEAYYQEAGRAGRDGEPGECLLLFSPQDILIQKFLIEQTQLDPDRKANEYKKLQAMTDYCHTPRCLRQHILRYFGEQAPDECGNCSHCNDDLQVTDLTVDAQKIFSCIYRMKERYGSTLVSQVLKGSKSKKVLQFGFDRLPTYGIMKQYTEKEIVDLINALIAEGYISLTEGQYPVLRLQARASRVLKGEEPVLQKLRISRKPEPVRDDGLFERLRELRKEISQRENVPPYVVFPDSTLREMSEMRPTDRMSMLSVKGVGETKFIHYGVLFMELIQEYLAEEA
ncbi:DNA helicase RecQ [Paenibacillus aurantius]|uniref:DNA helicase RecQ n=1 Tax=Paenibacillus aurantius TaxID=2918900 RepID=A0AA96LC28_9BACL|nr:DNA helicase RecQ [Paenibacillus aurantius]WNQ10545.1 DNA helicase RecQ [Paenibacillus aurantius]